MGWSSSHGTCWLPAGAAPTSGLVEAGSAGWLWEGMSGAVQVLPAECWVGCGWGPVRWAVPFLAGAAAAVPARTALLLQENTTMQAVTHCCQVHEHTLTDGALSALVMLPGAVLVRPSCSPRCRWRCAWPCCWCLQDMTRTGTYHAAITENRVDFEGKVVMDVGQAAGSCPCLLLR